MQTDCPHPTRYPPDLTDAAWELVAPPVTPDPHSGAPRSVGRRWVVTALCSIDTTGCHWQRLPGDLPHSGTGSSHVRRWRADGTLDRMHTAVRRMLRVRYGRDPDPSLASVDSHSVNTTDVGGDAGYDAGKQVYGRNRHSRVDPVGVLRVGVVTAAAVHDASSAPSLTPRLRAHFPRRQTGMADTGDTQHCIAWCARTVGWLVELVARTPHPRGVQGLPNRWLVERTLAWFNPYWRLRTAYAD